MTDQLLKDLIERGRMISMSKETCFTDNEIKFTDEDGNVDVVRCFWNCYEVQLHGRKTVIFPRKHDDDDLVCAKKVYEKLKWGYKKLEEWICKELECDRKIAESEGDESSMCTYCYGGLYNRCFNFMVLKGGIDTRNKLWEKYYELCCDENPIIVDAFINEAIDEDSCLKHYISKDGIELVTLRSPTEEERKHWEENNWYPSDEDIRKQAEKDGVPYEMIKNDPFTTAAWSEYKQDGKRDLFCITQLTHSLRKYPELWQEFCETERAEGREIKI